MTWWCSATGVPWTGEWRAYPGVWLFVLLLIGCYVRWGRPVGLGRRTADSWFVVGLLLLWAALDWPLGALGGYLAAAHTGQYLLLAICAPAFLLLAVQRRLAETAERGWLRTLAHPIAAFLGYNGVMLVTHLPAMVDRLMTTQLGSLTIDLAWLVSGLMLWWPVAAPTHYRRMQPPVQMGYLFLQTLPATLPAAFLVFSSYPLFKLYELSPRVTPYLTPTYDHQIAGLLMKVVGDPLIWIGIAVIFFRWANAERQADLARQPRLVTPSLDPHR